MLTWTGLLLRRRPAAHKRLMLLATIAILGPALARLARLPYFGGEGGPFVLIVTFALLIVCTAISKMDVGLGLVRWLQNNPL